MKGKQTALMAVVGMALLATVMTVSSPAPALALSHLNPDGDFTLNSDIPDARIYSSGTTDNTDEEVGAEEENDADDEDRMTTTTDGSNGEEDSDGNDQDSNENSNAEKDSSHIAYEKLLRCLLNVETETEQEVQDCFESSYGEMDNSENANDSEDEDEDEEDTEEDENSEE
jgi:hypothetical protein